ncbi:MAG: DUF1572 family protein [Flavisolibacter sp.]|nr:DUF1572 family protein [Flavisolibacter sp.]
MTIGSILLADAMKRFSEYQSLGEKAMEQLENEDLHFQHQFANSIAIIICHLHGNMLSRWTNFLVEDGEKPWRKRDEEFEIQTLSRPQLMKKWDEGWKLLMATLHSLKEEDLYKTITIRNQSMGVMDAILRQLAHYSYHIGQIVFIAKMLKGGAWKTLSIPKGGSKAYNPSLKS